MAIRRVEVSNQLQNAISNLEGYRAAIEVEDDTGIDWMIGSHL
jgi:hypothetical protein